jgi:hypothetical protein
LVLFEKFSVLFTLITLEDARPLSGGLSGDGISNLSSMLFKTVPGHAADEGDNAAIPSLNPRSLLALLASAVVTATAVEDGDKSRIGILIF